MTTLLMATAATAKVPDAQDARWNAWTSTGAASDRIARRRARIAFTTVFLVLAGAAVAMLL